jgi:hypothetical protein
LEAHLSAPLAPRLCAPESELGEVQLLRGLSSSEALSFGELTIRVDLALEAAHEGRSRWSGVGLARRVQSIGAYAPSESEFSARQ